MSSADDAREAAIDALIAKDALRELAMRYCRAIDRRDPELLRSVYHEDAMDEHGTVFSDRASVFVERQPEIMAPFELTAHYVTNTSYRLDGDRAEGELYFIAYHRVTEPKPQHIVVTGRYLDRYERRAGVWKIAYRRLVWDAVMSEDVRPEDGERLPTLGHVGRGADDLSYEALPLLARGR